MPVVDAFGLAYLVGALLVVLGSFHDAPQRAWRAYREGRMLQDPGYHVANAVSILVVISWILSVMAGIDQRVLPDYVPGPLARQLGLLVALVGFLVALWARRSLGAAFAPTAAVPADERIVDAGPYAHVRHPFYVGLMIALAGGVLVLDSLATLACLAALAPLVRAVAVKEESHLVEEVGEAYEAYRARVPRWLPRWPGGP